MMLEDFHRKSLAHKDVVRMAIVSKMVSDLTGKEGNESEFVTLTVREHPLLDEPKALDVLPDEVAGLKDAGNLVVLEIANGEKRQVVVTLAEFRKIVPDEVVAKARGTRGRRPGFRPS
jgi:hypothetical protein